MNKPLVSPSLWKPEGIDNSSQDAMPMKRGAFEVKFLIEESLAKELLSMVAKRMCLDSHSSPDTGSYLVEGIYFETKDRDVFRRAPGYSRRKYRMRRYSQGSSVFLERKAKRKGLVTKRRIELAETDVGNLLNQIHVVERDPISNAAPTQDSPVQSDLLWFCKRIHGLQLHPTLCIAYDRVAFLAPDCFGPIRLTIDRGLSCSALNHLSFPLSANSQKIFEKKCVLEMKFREALPHTFREIINAFSLISQPVSKFRNAIVACGLAPAEVNPPNKDTN